MNNVDPNNLCHSFKQSSFMWLSQRMRWGSTHQNFAQYQENRPNYRYLSAVYGQLVVATILNRADFKP